MASDHPFVVFIELLAIAVMPLSFICMVAAWAFAKRYWQYGARLPVVLAVVNTIAFPISAYFGVLAYRALADLPRLEGTGAVSLLAVALLDIIPLLTTSYLIWLELRRRRGEPPHPGDL